MKSLILKALMIFPIFETFIKTKRSQVPINFRTWFLQKVLGFNRRVYWPVHHSSVVGDWDKILIGVDTSPGYMPGCYIQGMGGISIGDYTQIAANVGIISQNHDVTDTRIHKSNAFPSVEIGKYCWIGMNSVVLPDVKLGDFTVVGAGSVVTKSFVDGYCVIAGNPARIIKNLDKSKCLSFENEFEYCGYIKKENMNDFVKSKLRLYS